MNRLAEARDETDIYILCAALAQANGVYSIAAELLGVSMRNMHYLVKRHRLRNADVEKYSAHFDTPQKAMAQKA